MAGSALLRRWPALIIAALALAACAAPGSAGSAGTGGASASPAATGSTAGTRAVSEAPVPTDPSLVQTPAGTVAATTVPPLTSCTAGRLPTVVPGKLTVGTGSPAAAPWYTDDDPANGRGLESSVAYAIADGLGFPADKVSWTKVDRTGASAGTVTGFDLDLDRFTAPDAGTTTADYSTGYFAVTDSVIVRAGTAKPSSAAAVTALDLGAVPGVDTAALTSAGANTPKALDGEPAAVTALTAGAVQGVVVPTPAALALAADDPSVVVAGQLPSDPSSQPDQFKVLLPKGSALTGCVSAVIDRLRVEGELETFAATWVDPVAPPLR